MRLKLNEHENIRPVETKDQGVVPTVYADAVDQMEKVEKIKDETTKIQEAPKHEEKGKNPKMAPGAKKMKLDESLFDFEDDDLESEYEVHYVVHSDVDENNIKREFDTEDEAIKYARENKVDETWVDEVIYYPETDEEETETIWTYQDDEIEESAKEKSVYETIMEGIDDIDSDGHLLRNISIEVYDDGVAYISEDNASGSRYDILLDDPRTIIEAFEEYINENK